MNGGAILVTLKEGHPPTSTYVHKLREALPAAFPEVTFYFQAADGETHIFTPLPCCVRTVGYHLRPTTSRSPASCGSACRDFSGIADVCVQQEVDAPEFYAEIDRARAAQWLTANSIATNLNVSLSSSVQVSPNFWTDPSSGTPYFLAVQTPEHRITSIDDLRNTPVGSVTATNATRCRASRERRSAQARFSVLTNANHANVQPVYEVTPMSRIPILGTVSAKIDKVVAELGKKLKPGNRIEVLGQIEEHEQRVPGHGPRPPVRVGVRLSPDGGGHQNFMILRTAGDILLHRHHAVHHAHHADACPR